MKIYEQPNIEIEKFEVEDIITTSDPNLDDNDTGIR